MTALPASNARSPVIVIASLVVIASPATVRSVSSCPPSSLTAARLTAPPVPPPDDASIVRSVRRQRCRYARRAEIDPAAGAVVSLLRIDGQAGGEHHVAAAGERDVAAAAEHSVVGRHVAAERGRPAGVDGDRPQRLGSRAQRAVRLDVAGRGRNCQAVEPGRGTGDVAADADRAAGGGQRLHVIRGRTRSEVLLDFGIGESSGCKREFVHAALAVAIRLVDLIVGADVDFVR